MTLLGPDSYGIFTATTEDGFRYRSADITAIILAYKEWEAMQARRYDCSECVNRGSPLCTLCSVVKHPDGTRAKPSYFVAHTKIPLDQVKSADRAEWLTQYVTAHVVSRTPIPLSIVMKYNEIVQRVM